MYKILMIIVSFCLLTINIYSQRNDGNRNGSVNRDKTDRIERQPVRTPQISNPKTGGENKFRNPRPVTYPKTPVQETEPVVYSPEISEVRCTIIYNPVSILKYDPPPQTDLEIATAFFNADDFYEASQAFTLHLSQWPDDTTALFFRGICYYEIEWYGFAIADFNLVLELDSLHAEAYYYRGLSRLFSEEKYEAFLDLHTAYDLEYELAGYILKKYF